MSKTENQSMWSRNQGYFLSLIQLLCPRNLCSANTLRNLSFKKNLPCNTCSLLLQCGALNVFIVITAQFLNVILIREIDRQNSRVPCPAIVVSGKLSEGQIQKIRLSKVVRMKQDAVFMKNLAVAQEIVHLIVARRTFVTMAQAAFPTKHSC